MFGKLLDSIAETVDELIDDPIGKSVEIVTQPLRDGIDVVQGLTEGELRVYAAARLGADVAGGMVLSELVEWYND